MPVNKHKKDNPEESRKAEREARHLRIKKELDEIIERTEGQNRALAKLLENQKTN